MCQFKLHEAHGVYIQLDIQRLRLTGKDQVAGQGMKGMDVVALEENLPAVTVFDPRNGRFRGTDHFNNGGAPGGIPAPGPGPAAKFVHLLTPPVLVQAGELKVDHAGEGWVVQGFSYPELLFDKTGIIMILRSQNRVVVGIECLDDDLSFFRPPATSS